MRRAAGRHGLTGREEAGQGGEGAGRGELGGELQGCDLAGAASVTSATTLLRRPRQAPPRRRPPRHAPSPTAALEGRGLPPPGRRKEEGC